MNICADITITTASGSFKLTDVEWSGCKKSIFAKSIGSELTNCSFTWSCSDISKDIWVFGDSYLTLSDLNRFPYHLFKKGCTDWLACGYPGAASAAELVSFKSLLELGTPKYAVWLLGMNDPDGSILNASWENCVLEFISLCEEHSITPILATIPSTWGSTSVDSDITVTRNNQLKSAWVRASGYRYIDFESAVAAEGGTGWKEGLLSSDGVHPTEAGAALLADQFICDMPEIAQ